MKDPSERQTMKKPDLIVFDLDGTLIDSRRDLAWSINAMRASFGLPELSEETVVSFIGNGARTLVERSLAGYRVDVDEAFRRYRRCYAGHLAVFTRLYPGVDAGLKTLHDNGDKLAVGTNKSEDSTLEILERIGIRELFDGVCGGDAGVPLKPAPDSLLAFKARFGSEECWMFGDNYTDLEAGRRAGFFRVFAGYGFGNAREEIPDLTVDSFAELVDAALNAAR